MQVAREQVAAQLVGAEQERHLVIPDAEQVQVAGDQIQQLVPVAAHQQAQRHPAAPVLGVGAAQGDRIAGLGERIHERAQVQPAVGEEVDALRRTEHARRIALGDVVRGDELGERGAHVQHGQHRQAHGGQPSPR